MLQNKVYNLILVYADGQIDTIKGTGKVDADGKLYMPESLIIGPSIFILNQEIRGKDWVQYDEVIGSKEPVPFKNYLH